MTMNLKRQIRLQEWQELMQWMHLSPLPPHQLLSQPSSEPPELKLLDPPQPLGSLPLSRDIPFAEWADAALDCVRSD
jgi:hypothetical protein